MSIITELLQKKQELEEIRASEMYEEKRRIEEQELRELTEGVRDLLKEHPIQSYKRLEVLKTLENEGWTIRVANPEKLLHRLPVEWAKVIKYKEILVREV